MKIFQPNWLFTGLLLFAGCTGGHSGDPHEEATPEMPEISVKTVAAEMLPGVQQVEVPGTVRSINEAVIAAKIQGQITAVPVVPGRFVEAGELLVEIDAGELKARRARAEAQLKQAEIEYERLEQLLERNAATQREFDNAALSRSAAEASLEEAETFLAYTEVRAPFTGVVSGKHVEVGDLATPGLPLIDLYDPTRFRLEVKVPESRARSMEPGETFRARIETLGLVLEGQVEEISPLADPASRTVFVKLALPRAEGVQSGQFGRLLLPVEEGETLAVPLSGILRRGQLEYVYVVHDRGDRPRAWLRLIKTGREMGDFIEVQSGLEPGERIVLDNLSRVRDGQPVRGES